MDEVRHPELQNSKIKNHKPGSFGLLIALPLLAFLLLPPLALVVRGRGAFAGALQLPDSMAAVGVSMRTSAVSLAILIVLGTPLAAALARSRGWLGRFVEVALDLPLVLPPAAAGIGLLLAFGRRGLVPTELPFTAGAVVAAQLFVSTPLYVRAATAAFRAVPGDVMDIASLEGADRIRRFAKIVLPISGPTLLSGAAMAWARALGEFGATILFAGSFPGRTETLPLAIYLGFENNLDQAIGLSLLLLGLALVVLVAARLFLGSAKADVSLDRTP